MWGEDDRGGIGQITKNHLSGCAGAKRLLQNSLPDAKRANDCKRAKNGQKTQKWRNYQNWRLGRVLRVLQIGGFWQIRSKIRWKIEKKSHLFWYPPLRVLKRCVFTTFWWFLRIWRLFVILRGFEGRWRVQEIFLKEKSNSK